MAVTQYGVNNALAVKTWAAKLLQEALSATYVSQFMGTTSDSLVQVRNELSKGPGDQITIGLRMQLASDGILGDGILEGNEESLITYSDALLINQLRNAVRSAGKMSQQRVPFDVRSEAMMGLKDWWTGRIDYAFFNQISGNTGQSDLRYTGGNATIAPSSGNYVYPTGTTSEATVASASASAVMSLQLIDYAVEKAKTLVPLIRPVDVKGDKMFVLFLHPHQVTDLRISTSTGQWLDIQKAVLTGGKIGDNPIFTGALGVYNNVVLHESIRVPLAPGFTNVRRAIFCGAQAAIMGFGQDGTQNKMTWNEELFDYGNQLGVAAGLIFGLKKAVFNSADFSTLILPTYAIAHT